ncbi:MAG: hypothetical protein P8J20_16300, partial [Novosphingobium sp.]|nr:hypothetical protein [Novosphingobium sp.]
MADKAIKSTRSWSGVVIGLLLGLVGLFLGGGGAWLLSLGGSAYYLIAGLGCLLSAYYYFKGRQKAAVFTYLAVFVGTCIWAVGEVGTEFWLLVPRVVGPAVFAALVVVHHAFTSSASRTRGWVLTGVAVAGLVALYVSMTGLPATTGGSKTGALAKVAD